MLRQAMDAATLANDGNMSGFVSERLGLEGDEIRMVLGKFIKIPDTVGDMQSRVMHYEIPRPERGAVADHGAAGCPCAAHGVDHRSHDRHHG
jgi:hypothetical protein